MAKARVVVLISGRGSNLSAILEAAAAPDYPAAVVAVIANKADAPGLQLAAAAGVATEIVPSQGVTDRTVYDQSLQDAIDRYVPDLIVLAGFMRILPANFVQAMSPNLINTHPSLLPAFPGAHAVRDALSAGAKTTGVTVHVVDEGVDTGPQLAQREVQVEDNDTEAALHERIKVVERELLVDVVRQIAEQKLQLSA